MSILLSNIIPNIIVNKLMLPEILIAGLACFILLIDLIVSKKHKFITYLLTQIGLLVVMMVIYKNFSNLCNLQTYQEENIFLINNGFTLNTKINFMKLIFLSLVFIIFIYMNDYFKTRNQFNGEYLVLNLLSMLGAMLLVSSNNFFNFYFAIEMLSLPIYALIAMDAKNINLEASIKYFILSAVFSGILLYGLSLVYGASGSLDFKSTINFIDTQHISMLFNVGVMLVFIGIFFKLSLAPFHLWIPDVYQGAGTTVVMLISSLPKIAMVSIFSSFLAEVFSKYINYNWQTFLIVISILSMLIGNFGAILQSNFKRLLGYSAIGHAGFILLGLAANNVAGVTAANFYVILYAFMIIGILGVIAIFSNNQIEFDDIRYFSGLSKKHPWISGMLLILLLSMSGIPPTAGFYAKFLIIKALIGANLVWVAVVALLLSLISLFYYLKIVKTMYFFNNDFLSDNQDNYAGVPVPTLHLKSNYSSIIVLSINSICILSVGIYPLLIDYVVKKFFN